MGLLTATTRLASLSTLLLVSGLLRAHGGGLDTYGCHRDNKAGGYHCHSGPLAGQKFTSQAEMLEKLKALESKHSVEDRLRELKQLKDKGLISEEEYAKQRERLLNEL